MSSLCKNVFEAILRYGHDEILIHKLTITFSQPMHLLVSAEKIDVLRRRVELGQPLGTMMIESTTAA